MTPPSVEPLLAEVRSLQTDLERGLGGLATSMGSLGGDLSGLLPELQKLDGSGPLQDLGAEADAQRPLRQALKTLLSVRTELVAHIAQLHDSERTVTTKASQAKAATNDILSSLTELDQLSARLHLIALNASASAAGAEAAGTAFALGELSASTTSAAQQIRSTAVAMGERVETIQSVQEVLVSAISGPGVRGDDVGAATYEANSVLDRLAQHLGDAERVVETSLPVVGRIMVTIQREDIIRQKVDHVVLALQELEQNKLEDGDAEELRGKIGRLSCRLLADIESDITTLLADLRATSEPLRGVETALSIFSQGMAPAEVRKVLSAPADTLFALSSAVLKVTDLLTTDQEASTEIQALTKRLASELSPLTDLDTQLSSIKVHIPAETPRRAALGDSLDAPMYIAKVKAQCREVTLTIQRKADILSTSIKAIARGKRAVQEVGARLQTVKTIAIERADELRLRADAFMTTFERAARMGQAQEVASQNFSDALRVLDSQHAKFGTLLEHATALANEMQSGAPSLRPEDVDAELQKLVERFTVLSHKQSAQEVADISVESGDLPGTLTLF